MTRLSLIALVVLTSWAGAQDMPLHEIIKAGETWRAHAKPILTEPSVYIADPTNKKVKRDQQTYAVPLAEPSCTALWHGGATLLVGDAGGKHVWAFRIDQDGTLNAGDKYIPLRVRKGATRSDVSALCVDRANRVYAATNEGVQVFDPTGRMCGVLTSPTTAKITALTFVGHELYAVAGDKVYVRTMLAQGVAAKEQP